MIGPGFGARIEEPDEFTGYRINTRKIGAFVQAAPIACEREIRRFIDPAMFARNNVIDMKGANRGVLLSKTTIFTASVSSPPDERPYGYPHQGNLLAASIFLA